MGRDNLDNAKHPGFGQSAGSSAKRLFSNDWKNFPMVGKFGPIFPMIGKNFRAFPHDWKTDGEANGRYWSVTLGSAISIARISGPETGKEYRYAPKILGWCMRVLSNGGTAGSTCQLLSEFFRARTMAAKKRVLFHTKSSSRDGARTVRIKRLSRPFSTSHCMASGISEKLSLPSTTYA